ncbi:hypothetical protein HI914_05068 [Erysiphe necator]|nr:hypothetical protein HI914_05068 [Erysiphe necator]
MTNMDSNRGQSQAPPDDSAIEDSSKRIRILLDRRFVRWRVKQYMGAPKNEKISNLMILPSCHMMDDHNNPSFIAWRESSLATEKLGKLGRDP